MLRGTCHFSLAYYIVEQLFCVYREIPNVQVSRHEIPRKKKGKRELCFHPLEIHGACDMEEIVVAICRRDDFAVRRMAFFRKRGKPLQPIN